MDKTEEKLKRKTNLFAIIWKLLTQCEISSLPILNKLRSDQKVITCLGFFPSNFFLENIQRDFLFK